MDLPTEIILCILDYLSPTQLLDSKKIFGKLIDVLMENQLEKNHLIVTKLKSNIKYYNYGELVKYNDTYIAFNEPITHKINILNHKTYEVKTFHFENIEIEIVMLHRNYCFCVGTFYNHIIIINIRDLTIKNYILHDVELYLDTRRSLDIKLINNNLIYINTKYGNYTYNIGEDKLSEINHWINIAVNEQYICLYNHGYYHGSLPKLKHKLSIYDTTFKKIFSINVDELITRQNANCIRTMKLVNTNTLLLGLQSGKFIVYDLVNKSWICKNYQRSILRIKPINRNIVILNNDNIVDFRTMHTIHKMDIMECMYAKTYKNLIFLPTKYGYDVYDIYGHFIDIITLDYTQFKLCIINDQLIVSH